MPGTRATDFSRRSRPRSLSRRRTGHAVLHVDVASVCVDLRRVRAMRVDPGPEPAVSEQPADPRAVVALHGGGDGIHVLEIQEDDGAIGEPLGGSLRDRVRAFGVALRGAQQRTRARGSCRRGVRHVLLGRGRRCAAVAGWREEIASGDSIGDAVPRLLSDVDDGEAPAERCEPRTRSTPRGVAVTRRGQVVSDPLVRGAAVRPRGHRRVARIQADVESRMVVRLDRRWRRPLARRCGRVRAGRAERDEHDAKDPRGAASDRCVGKMHDAA